MPKKSEREERREGELIAWYKWEFLRRNPQYKIDYGRYVSQYGPWFKKHGQWHEAVPWSQSERKYFGKVIAPRTQKLCERWQIIEPLPASWKFSKSGDYEYKEGEFVELPTGFTPDGITQFWKRLRHDFQLSASTFEKSVPSNTDVTSDLDRIRHYRLHLDFAQPLRALLAQAKQEITQRKQRYDRAHPKQPPTMPSKRRRIDLYDNYLRVWDLKEEQCLTFVAIGSHVYPGMAAAPKRAEDNFRAARRLIMGGYREIR